MKKLIENYVEAWNTHNTGKLAELFSTSAVYTDPLQQGNALEVVSRSLNVTIEAFPDVTFQMLSLVESAAGGKVFVLEWQMNGTHTGPYFGAGPTHKSISITGLDLITTDDGKISEIKSFYDSNQFNVQLEI